MSCRHSAGTTRKSDPCPLALALAARLDRPLSGPRPRQILAAGPRLDTEADGTRRVTFTIRDRGRWRTPTDGVTTRGHGVRLMRACAEDVSIDHGPDGTTVVLHSRPMPPPLRRR